MRGSLVRLAQAAVAVFAVVGIATSAGAQGKRQTPAQAAPAPTPPAPAPAAEPLTPEKVRPPASLLIDCKDAPAAAVTTVPEPLSRWATIYCTRLGHIFSANDKFYSLYTGTKVRGALNAAELTGRKGNLGHAAHFTKITYEKLDPKAAQPLMTGAQPSTLGVVKDKELFKVDLTVDTGQVFSLVVADPAKDPFWVIPVVNGRLNNVGFYVASLDYMNRKR